MKSIIFFDTEIEPELKTILDLGAVKENGEVFHSSSLKDFIQFTDETQFICGHNVFNHDLKYIHLDHLPVIDTLYFSPLLFPQKPYHRLVKDDKLQTDELNNPVNDSLKARDLFYDELSRFTDLPDQLKQIYFLLLSKLKEFSCFFQYVSFTFDQKVKTGEFICEYFKGRICSNVVMEEIIANYPAELAYCLAIINVGDKFSITPPWVLHGFPMVDNIMFLLCGIPCIEGCVYCNNSLDIHKGLKDFFGYDSFRTYADEPLQEKAIQAAVDNKSLLAVFPTGGGKSITFQLPALMAGENIKGLTVIISPLQSLMKDQVDNLENNGITSAVTINGMLDPIERGESFKRVKDGSVSILYISPESLRSKTIESLLLGRKISRFVIDEAHCFSSWGHDFRVDYMYIADFINSLENKKSLSDKIPVSCFTATAKQKVIEDICQYFKEKLSLSLEIFKTNVSRVNLTYKVFNSEDEAQKYNKLRYLIESKDCPAIIYVSRTHKAYKLAQQLSRDGFNAAPYHGKMDVSEKTANQNAFIKGELQIIVATSAFGMGVDKKDVGMVIHYEISDSLENYVQESGRAGRDESISADCCVLFNEEDLSKHFILLNQTKLSIKEIQQIWKAIKQITRFRLTVSNSALEIARQAGWDDNVVEIETRVTTAIAALEHAGYLKRGQNIPRIYANSILSKNAMEAIDKINDSQRFDNRQKVLAIRIIKKLFSTKSHKHANDEAAEARVDYISDHLGVVRADVINIITLLREEKILADTKDLTAFIKKSYMKNQSFSIVKVFGKIEDFLLDVLAEHEADYNIKEFNEALLQKGSKNVNPHKIKMVLNFWAVKNWIKQQTNGYSPNHITIILTQTRSFLKKKIEKKYELSKFIINFLYGKIEHGQYKSKTLESYVEEELVEFSVHELKHAYQNQDSLFSLDVDIEDIEDTLFYLSRIEALKIEGGFLVIYNKLTIDRLETNNHIKFKKDDYKNLDTFYNNKVQQIHIVGEYAKKMLKDYNKALGFVNDYFKLNYPSFLNKYFPGGRKNEIKKNITPKKFRELFGSLSLKQLEIIKDNKSKNIVVAAGPGSGKTRVLVHKLASLLLMEDVKHEQLLMLTFSRAAATEFKKRLLGLIGNAANFIEIKTFHSFCFDLLGRVGNIEKSYGIIQTTCEKILNGEVTPNRITKSVLVIDEAQDMDFHEFSLIKALLKKNEEMRVIAVGDDDQNIYTFRGADSKYFEKFASGESFAKYELVENFRSRKNLVEFTNKFAETIKNRFKSLPITPVQKKNGNIKIVQYRSDNLIVPLVNTILASDLSGTTAVLTKTNKDAVEITGLLLKSGLPARLIQSNDGFNLFNIYELREFIDELKIDKTTTIINDENWDRAKIRFAKRYSASLNFELCKILIQDFQITNPTRKYKSDFETFIRESSLEDFIVRQGGTIYVSTIHKAKGSEFDNLFLLLNRFDQDSDNNKRQLYVAMTRAKQNLFIHLNSRLFSNTAAISCMTISEDVNKYAPPEHLLVNLTHKDINLGYFSFIQHRINLLQTGNNLLINEQGLTNLKGEMIIKFSKSFAGTRVNFEKMGYRLIEAEVNFILYWTMPAKEEMGEKEIKIILPRLYFVKDIN